MLNFVLSRILFKKLSYRYLHQADKNTEMLWLDGGVGVEVEL